MCVCACVCVCVCVRACVYVLVTTPHVVNVCGGCPARASPTDCTGTNVCLADSTCGVNDACATNTDCTDAGKPVCNSGATTPMCVECVTPAHCAGDEYCMKPEHTCEAMDECDAAGDLFVYDTPASGRKLATSHCLAHRTQIQCDALPTVETGTTGTAAYSKYVRRGWRPHTRVCACMYACVRGR